MAQQIFFSFMGRIVKDAACKALCIVGNLNVHHGKIAKGRIGSHKEGMGYSFCRRIHQKYIQMSTLAII